MLTNYMLTYPIITLVRITCTELPKNYFQVIFPTYIKDHLHNLLPEIPHLLSPGLKEQCQRLLDTTIPKQKVSGAILRTATLKLFLLLLQHEVHVNPLVVQLIRSVVKICKLFYQCDSKRTPKSVLQLYNVTWLHHELCAQP